MTLYELKNRYDNELKKLVKQPGLFRDDTYSVYFKKCYFCSEIIQKMEESDYISYLTGAGSELIEHVKNGKIIPASMSSVASSSRFCYLSLKDSDFSVFGVKNYPFQSHPRRFEEKLPIGGGTPPHMDCYYEDDNELVCFECKCHEQFDDHKIELAESYFSSDRIVNRIEKEYYIEEHKPIRKDGKLYYYNVISPAFVGLGDNPRFDIKQFLTHIMGIQSRLSKLKKSKARLIYYYFIPDKVLNDSEIKKIIDQLYKEIKQVFSSDFVKNYTDSITFELFVQYSDTVENASNNNTKRIVL